MLLGSGREGISPGNRRTHLHRSRRGADGAVARAAPPAEEAPRVEAPNPGREPLVGLLVIEITGFATVEALNGVDAAEALRSNIEMRLWEAVPEGATTWPMGRTRFAVSITGTDRRDLERLARRLRRRLVGSGEQGETSEDVEAAYETKTGILIGGAIATPALAVTLGATASRALDQARSDSSGVVVRARRKPSGTARGANIRPIRVDMPGGERPRDDLRAAAPSAVPTDRSPTDVAPSDLAPSDLALIEQATAASGPARQVRTPMPGMVLRAVTPRDRPETVAFELATTAAGGERGMALFDAALRLLAHEPTRRVAVERPASGSATRLRDRMRVLAAMVPGLLDRMILVLPVGERPNDGAVELAGTLRRFGPAIALAPRGSGALARITAEDGPLVATKPDFLILTAPQLAEKVHAAGAIAAAHAGDVGVVAELDEGAGGLREARRLGVDYLLATTMP
ncbi:MAG: hypothetical protein AAF899_03615 [Pseudomonadota bacterium]